MGSPVTKWKAIDGAEFGTQKDMLLHELSLNEATEIDIFLSTQYASSRRKAEYKRVLAQFAEYMRDARYTDLRQETASPLESLPLTEPPASIVEWVPEGGYKLQEGAVIDDLAAIERSFRKAQKI